MTFLDRIKETSTSTGTGTFTLGGAVLGYKVFTNGTYKYCIVNETESEWEVGEGTVASGVLTRTTIEASSNGGAAVVFTAGTKYVFNTVSAAYVNSLVPYTGATAAVNLGTYGLTSDYLQLNTTPTATGAVGRMLWNDTDGTYDIGMKGGNVTLQVGQEQLVRVVNKVGSSLLEANYQAVYISGAQGQRPKVALALGNSDATSASTIGLVTETIADNQEGFITTSGIVRGINTTGSLQGETWNDGQILYLSPTTAGRITNIKPTAPNHTVVIGYVIYAHATQGKIFVKVDNGYEIGELHDVYAPSPATGNGLFWNATNSRYELNTIAGVLGYTPADDSLVMHLAGAENITGVKTFQNALQTTAGNNLLNTGGGNTVIGYTADPATSGTYKLDVNGQSRFVGNLLSFNGSNLRAGLYTSSGWGKLDLYYGSLAVRLDPSSTSYMCLGGANLVLGATTGNNSAILYMQSTVQGFRLPNMTTIQKNAIVSPTTSLLVYDTDLAAFQYYTGSAWTGLGGGITGSGTAGQLTYWSGTSAVTGSSNLFWDNTNGRLGIGTNSPNGRFHISDSNNVNANIVLNLRDLQISSNFAAVASLITASNASPLNNSIFLGIRARGTITNPTPPLQDDAILGLLSNAYDGTASGGGTAGIYFYADTNVTLNNAPQRISFVTSLTNNTARTEKLQIRSNGNVLIQNGGTFTDGGQRLQVIGSMRVGTTAASAMYWDDTNNRLNVGTSVPLQSGQFNVVQSVNGTSGFSVKNTSAGTSAQCGFYVENNTGNVGQLFKTGGSYTTYKNIANGDLGFYNGTGQGNISLLNDNTSGNINFAAGGSSSAHMTIKSNGRINMSSLPTSSAGLSAGDLWNNLGIINIV